MVHTDDWPHECYLCSKQFKRHKDLRSHIKHVHTKRTREFSCLECNKVFSTTSSLIRHQNIHKNNEEGFPECYFCHKKISRSSNLVDHLRIHTQEKPFACKEEICKYSTAKLSHLKQHQRRLHSSTLTSNRINVRIWKCYFCFKTHRQFDSLTIHMRRHTTEFPFKCNFCKKNILNRIP